MSFREVQDRVAAATARVGRDPDDVTLVAVSKGHPAAAIEPVYEAGHRDFGESRAQELVAKAEQLPSDIRWHFIGPLQRNKVRLVRPTAVLLHSMDRFNLAAAWLKGPGLPPPVLLQVNVGREPQKKGVDPDEAAGELEAMCALGLEVRGLMTIPPQVADADEARPYFAELEALRDQLRTPEADLSILSMGMTDDFEIAIEEGSTMIRVGRAIFGERETHG